MIMSPDDIVVRKRMTIVWAGANFCLLLLAILVIAFERPVSGALRMMLGGAGV
jgi:hypothetical protein